MIKLFQPHMPKSVDQPLLQVLHSGYITQGPKVDEFEQKFCDVFGHKNAVSINSGTSALTLALRLAGVGPGDEVITTPMTCTATNLPILSLGAKPVFADIDPISGLISTNSVSKLVTTKTKAIMAVDWSGSPVDVETLNAIAADNNLKVIVDAAHALGTNHNAEPDFTCYSLQAIKHITTVDGGVLICADDKDYHRAKVLRWFGIDRELPSLDSRIDQDIEEWGYKFHMNDVAATIGIEQLNHADYIIQAYRENAAYLHEMLDKSFYAMAPLTEGSYWIFTVLLPNSKLRRQFKEYMEDHDIMVSQVHKRNDEYAVFKPYKVSTYSEGELYYRDFPGVDNFSERMICLPVHWALTSEDRDKIVQTANAFAELQR
jgi:perosamine synthetase